MLSNLIPTPSERATIRGNSAFTLLRYRVAPFNRYSQAALAMNDGAILQNVMRHHAQAASAAAMHLSARSLAAVTSVGRLMTANKVLEVVLPRTEPSQSEHELS